MQWTSWATSFLGIWLLFSPSTLGIGQRPLALSDALSGVLTLLLSVWDIWKQCSWKKWTLCFLGAWLLFAPLIFWARQPAVYGNDTLAGILLIVFSVGLRTLDTTQEIPPGWTYNPASWHHRVPVIVLALAGFFLARYMSAYQLGHISRVWDPFFGRGTILVLTSDVAESFPISDAGLGAVSYLLEGLSGVVGDTRRWRTMPCMVFLFFLLVVPAGVVSIVLIMLQPVVVGAWCTICLITAVVTLISIPPAVDEIFASTQYLSQIRRAGRSAWKAFWMGGPPIKDEPSTVAREGDGSRIPTGIDLTWTLALSVAVGLWIVISPAFIDVPRTVANSSTVVGALVVTFAVLATAEPLRSVRFINILFAAWILAIPFWAGRMPWTGHLNLLLCGAALIPLSFPKGKINNRYGSWDRFIR